jgi:hypothetical protein
MISKWLKKVFFLYFEVSSNCFGSNRQYFAIKLTNIAVILAILAKNLCQIWTFMISHAFFIFFMKNYAQREKRQVMYARRKKVAIVATLYLT